MVRDILGPYQINIIIDNTSGSKILFINHGGMLNFSGWFPLIGPNRLEESSISSLKTNSKSTDSCEKLYDSDLFHTAVLQDQS